MYLICPNIEILTIKCIKISKKYFRKPPYASSQPCILSECRVMQDTYILTQYLIFLQLPSNLHVYFVVTYPQ